MTPIENIEQLSASVTSLTSELTAAQELIATAGTKEAALNLKCGELESQLVSHGEKIATLSGELEKHVAKISELTTRAESAEGKLSLAQFDVVGRPAIKESPVDEGKPGLISIADFHKFTPQQKMDFAKTGGKIA